MEDASIIATNKLNNLVFNSGNNGGLPAFVNNFCQYVLDLEEVQMMNLIIWATGLFEWTTH